MDRRIFLSSLSGSLTVPALGLAAFGLPEKALAQGNGAPPLSVYGRLPYIENIALSPSGTHIGLAVNQNGQRAIFDIRTDTGEKTGRIVGTNKLRGLTYADDNRLVAVFGTQEHLAAFSGGENEYFVGLSIDMWGGNERKLFEKMNEFYPMVTGNLNRVTLEGKPYITASNIRLSGSGISCLYAFDLTTGYERLLDETYDRAQDWVVTPEGHVLGRSDFDAKTAKWQLKINADPARKNWKLIHSLTDQIDYPILEGLGRDGKSLLVLFRNGGTAGDYHEINADGVLSEPLGPSGVRRHPLFHPATRRLAGFVTYDQEKPRIEAFDPLLDKLAKAIESEFEDQTIHIITEMADDPRRMVIYTEAADNAGAYVFMDFTDGNFADVGKTRPELPADWIARQERITYTAADQLKIVAYLTFPPGREAKNLPLIVMPHGGPQSHDGPGFDWMAQALASRGYLVVQPNFRGSTGYGQSFVDAGHGEWGRKMQTDLSDGVRHLVTEGFADPKRVAILGASYGGYAALAGATLDPGVYKAAVAIAPVSNLKSFVQWVFKENDYKDYDPAVLYWKRFMGPEKEWDAVSPDVQAAKADCPVLLIHGKDDDTVPFEQSERMRNALKKAGKSVDLIILKAEDHYLSNEPTRMQALEASVAFLLKHNPPG